MLPSETPNPAEITTSGQGFLTEEGLYSLTIDSISHWVSTVLAYRETKVKQMEILIHRSVQSNRKLLNVHK